MKYSYELFLIESAMLRENAHKQRLASSLVAQLPRKSVTKILYLVTLLLHLLF